MSKRTLTIVTTGPEKLKEKISYEKSNYAPELMDDHLETSKASLPKMATSGDYRIVVTTKADGELSKPVLNTITDAKGVKAFHKFVAKRHDSFHTDWHASLSA